KVEEIETPKLSALEDAQYLNAKLFGRIKAVYDKRKALNLDAESLRLVERTYDDFTHAGANLSDADKGRLKEINGQLAVLENAFRQKRLGAARAGAFNTADKTAFAGLSDGQVAAAEAAAAQRRQSGYTIPLQNTTQQPALESLVSRATRQSLFELGWNRA